MKPWLYVDLHNGRDIVLDRLYRQCKKLLHKATDANKDRTEPLFTEVLPAPNEIRSRFEAVFKKGFQLKTSGLGEEWGGAATLSNIKKWINEVASHSGGLSGITIDGASHAWLISKDACNQREVEFLETFVSKFCARLAKDYGCPVWVTHHLAAKACEVSPIARISHHDAAGCRAFANALSTCFVFGTRPMTAVEDIFSLRCTKGVGTSKHQDQVLLTFAEDDPLLVEVHGYQADVVSRNWVRARGKRSLLSST